MNRRYRSWLLAVLAGGAALLTVAACQQPAPVPAPVSAASPAAVATASQPLPLIPMPAVVEPRPGAFTLQGNLPILLDSNDPRGQDVVRFIAPLVDAGRSGLISRASATGGADVRLDIDAAAAGAGEEDYTLDVTPQGIRVRARRPAGLFYGAISAWQLLTPPAPDGWRRVPCVHIEDHPRFAWRGLMLDVARHYMPPQFIEQLIDWMALHKLNTLHWHLTDDQGWRLEIKKYPRLTAIGAWRIEPDGTRSGGFYTQELVRALVRYAAARHVAIVPEIDMPGHAQAAIAAYPWLGVAGGRLAVSHDWGINPYLFNVDERTFGFIDDVLGEVLELFPSHYIHVGGDEAIKTQWKASRKVQARMRALGLKDEDALQGWFMQRLETWLAAHGRKLVGWDEIVDAGLPADATVMSWRGTAGGIAAARAGHDVIMSPADSLYFDHVQGPGHDEPPGRPKVHSLAEVYAFDPLPRELDAAQARHIIGLQANVWTEHIATPAQVQHAVFPRIAALAETAWSPAAAHDWPGFLHRLLPMLGRYRALGIAYAESAFTVEVTVQPAGPGAVSLSLATQSGVGDIRYTLDGSDPGPSSPLYQSPLQVKLPAELRAAPFVDGQAIAAVTRRKLDAASLLTRDSDGLGSCSDKLPLRLTGPAQADGTPGVYRIDIMDPCWTWAAAPLDGIKRIELRIARLPYNFQLGADNDKRVLRPPHRAGGELEVHGDHCDGPLLATLPLRPDTAAAGPQTLEADLAAPGGTHDLCLFFTRKSPKPLWAIDTVRLLPP